MKLDIFMVRPIIWDNVNTLIVFLVLLFAFFENGNNLVALLDLRIEVVYLSC